MKSYPILNKLSIQERIPRLLCCAILVTLPFQEINNVLSMVFAVYGLFEWWRAGFRIDRNDWMIFLPALLLGFYLIGLLWSVDFVRAWKQVEKILLFAAFPVGLYGLRHRLKQEDLVFVLNTWVFLCLLASLICYVNAAQNIIGHDSFSVVEHKERQYYYYSYLYLVEPVGIDPIYLSLYVNFSIVILVLRPFAGKIANMLIVGYLVVFNVLISSKIGIIALVVVGLLYLLYRIRNKYMAVGAAAVLLILLIAVIQKSHFLRSRFVQATTYEFDDAYAGNWNSISQRLAIWKCAAEAAADVFPLGYGTGSGQYKLHDKYVKYHYTRGIEDNYNAHSEYLFTLLDIGALGLVVVLLMIILPLVRAFRTNNHMLFCLQCFILIYFSVEVIFARRFGIFFYAFFYPLLFVYGMSATDVKRTTAA
ncbi:O-antigen ligase family protein [Chryseolinea lacunae]|uniref:O-antigen ligase family protein n=1 Tax=Chryseolinea lacunae TaxID=2801331 RepID=A0ABS1KS01_9BACT|nr:O-antigen ligase family protein [Chryseolinea lacunae]MBL0742224.1 O-antigen ligase family protein [Chryseolinea lacunae]